MYRLMLKNQRGIAPIGLIVVALIIVGIIVAAIFFILNGDKKEQTLPQADKTIQGSDQKVTSEDVPLTICETKDPEQCDDPVSNADVDNIRIEDPDGL